MVYSISDAVQEVLIELTFLRAAMEYDLVNYSALARFIQPVVSNKVGYRASLDAVAVAVRRYIEANNLERDNSRDLLDVVKNSKLILRTDLSSTLVRNWQDVDFLKNLEPILEEVDFRAGEKMYLILRSNELFLVFNSRFMAVIESKITPPAEIVNRTSSLALLTVNVQRTNFEVPGVLQFFARQFEMAGINLHDVFTTQGKITFIFAQKDAAKAYERISAAIESVKTMPFKRI